MIQAGDNILIVAAHPDDEVLGCGGTVSRAVKKYGSEITVNALILSEGLMGRSSEDVHFEQKDLDAFYMDAVNAGKIVGIQHSYFERLPNNRLDSMDLLDVIKIIEKYIAEIQPTVVLTHHNGDLNIAHRIVYQAALTACRPLGECPVNRMLSFEIPSSTEWAFPIYKSVFSPNVFFEIGDAVETKIEAMECYQTERRAFPHPRSPEIIRAIAQRWGSVANMDYAEAFELIYTRNHFAP